MSERWSNGSGQSVGGAEYDPTHSAVGLDDPGPGPDGTSADLLYPRNGDPTDLSGGCMIDGMVAPCSVAMSSVNADAGVATDPYETPSTRWNLGLNGGQGGFEIFHAFADGNYGYLPITAHYAKNGAWWDNVTGKEGKLGQSGRGKVRYLEANNPVNPWIESILDGFSKLPKCLEAYAALDIDLKKLLDKGLVVGGSHLFEQRNAEQLGLTQYTYDNAKEQGIIGSGSVDAFTVPEAYKDGPAAGRPLVTWGGPHIFLNAGATTGGYNNLKRDLAHELIHAGGYAPNIHWYTGLFGTTDLDHLGDKLKAVNRECGEAVTPP